jgi:hypothetical protein
MLFDFQPVKPGRIVGGTENHIPAGTAIGSVRDNLPVDTEKIAFASVAAAAALHRQVDLIDHG